MLNAGVSFPTASTTIKFCLLRRNCRPKPVVGVLTKVTTYLHVFCCVLFLRSLGGGVGVLGFCVFALSAAAFVAVSSSCHPFKTIKSMDKPVHFKINRSTSRTVLFGGTTSLSTAMIASPTLSKPPPARAAGEFGAISKIIIFADNLTRRRPSPAASSFFCIVTRNLWLTEEVHSNRVRMVRRKSSAVAVVALTIEPFFK